jgi:hypothetical protein
MEGYGVGGVVSLFLSFFNQCPNSSWNDGVIRMFETNKNFLVTLFSWRSVGWLGSISMTPQNDNDQSLNQWRFILLLINFIPQLQASPQVHGGGSFAFTQLYMCFLYVVLNTNYIYIYIYTCKTYIHSFIYDIHGAYICIV